MANLKIHKMVLGAVMTNCYLVYNDLTKDCLIIDPADDADRIRAAVTKLLLNPKAILLTHGHFDHILAADDLKSGYQIPVYAHEEEVDLAASESLNAAAGFGFHGSVQIDNAVRDGETLYLAGFSITVLHTPGHTRGGVCYYFSEDGILFSGDTLFAQSVGRTDLPTGSYSQLIRSVKNKIFVLPDDVRVFPGHMEETSVGYEKKYNHYIV